MESSIERDDKRGRLRPTKAKNKHVGPKNAEKDTEKERKKRKKTQSKEDKVRELNKKAPAFLVDLWFGLL